MKRGNPAPVTTIKLPEHLREALADEVQWRLAHGVGRPNVSAVVRDAVLSAPVLPPLLPWRGPGSKFVCITIPERRLFEWPPESLARAAVAWYCGLPRGLRERDCLLPCGSPAAAPRYSLGVARRARTLAERARPATIAPLPQSQTNRRPRRS